MLISKLDRRSNILHWFCEIAMKGSNSCIIKPGKAASICVCKMRIIIQPDSLVSIIRPNQERGIHFCFFKPNMQWDLHTGLKPSHRIVLIGSYSTVCKYNYLSSNCIYIF